MWFGTGVWIAMDSSVTREQAVRQMTVALALLCIGPLVTAVTTRSKRLRVFLVVLTLAVLAWQYIGLLGCSSTWA